MTTLSNGTGWPTTAPNICIDCECGQTAALLVADGVGEPKGRAYLLCCAPAAKPCTRELRKRWEPWAPGWWEHWVNNPNTGKSTRWHMSIDDAIAQWREMHGGGR